MIRRTVLAQRCISIDQYLVNVQLSVRKSIDQMSRSMFFQSHRSFTPTDFTDTTREAETDRGWPATTGTSRETRRWEETVT